MMKTPQKSRPGKSNRWSRRRLRLQALEPRMLLHAEGVVDGSVFFDSNGDGARDATEVGAAGIVIDLRSSDQSVSRSTITDNLGNFSFKELEPGNYQITKRQMKATIGASDAAVLSLTLQDDEVSDGNLFAERAIHPAFVNVGWFFATSPSEATLVRRAIALGERLAGQTALAESILAGDGVVPANLNRPPVVSSEAYEVDTNSTLDVGVDGGVLANDSDADGDTITAQLVDPASHGSVVLNQDGSFQYTPNVDFGGIDTFSYRATDGLANSNPIAVTITVNDGQGVNRIPQARDDSYEARENDALVIETDRSVIANDFDLDSDPLTAALVDQPTNGSVTLNEDGSFTYEGDSEFFGDDSFTYVVSDGIATSNVATVSIAVRPIDDGTPFASVTTGSFEASNLRGTRTDLLPGAPPITANHVIGSVDYSNHSNPPTYGDHHGFDPQGTDANPGITPRPTGIYTEEQPDEDLIHNLEHGHVWISYDPSQLSNTDIAALEQLVRDGSGNADGSGSGVILTPRAANDQPIALASWARLETLDRYDPDIIREFVNINRGKAPEGFITP